MKKVLPPLRLPPKKRPPPKKKQKSLSFFWMALFLISLFYIWILVTTLVPPLPQPHQPPILYSNQCKQDLRMTLLRGIKKAKQSIHLVMYNLSEPSILTALKKKHLDQVSVEVFLDPKSSSVRAMGDLATPVKTKGLMHQKILILDNKMVFIGSANMTTASLRIDDNLTLGFYSSEVASFLKKKTPYLSGHLRCMVGGQDLEIWLLPDLQKKALYTLMELMRNAKKEIHLSMFTLTHNQLIDGLIAAHKRGVKVKIILDKQSAFGTSNRALEKLQREHIPVLLSQGIKSHHHKHLYIDQRILVCGSTNWTQAAFSSNRDCMVILYNLNSSQRRFMNKLEKAITIDSKKSS